MEDEIVDEILIDNNMVQMGSVFNICRATVKIQLKNGGISSGFFLKFERNEKMFHCIMTNQHVIKSDMIEKGDEIITVKYENEKKQFNIKLDTKERIIKEFNTELKIDVTIIEIIEKDNIIDDVYFLSANTDSDENNEDFLGKSILIAQYPNGKLSLSNGKILEIDPKNDYLFYHTADTEPGSSGSPIVLKGEEEQQEEVIAIHKGGVDKLKRNAGFFIGIIIDIMMAYRKNGQGLEYYKNGNVKYKGNFHDDEYEGEGKLYYENGQKKYEGMFSKGEYNGKGTEYYDYGKKKYEGQFLNGEYNGEGEFYDENDEIYIGQFKNGKKNGNGCIIKNNKLIKEGPFENDEFMGDDEGEDNPSDNNIDGKVENNNKGPENDENYFNVKEKEVGNQDNNNNNNYNNNINNNNGNNNNDNEDFWREMQTHAYHVLHPLGNLLGIRCKRCCHLVKNHHENEFYNWLCDDCPKNDNICTKK